MKLRTARLETFIGSSRSTNWLIYLSGALFALRFAFQMGAGALGIHNGLWDGSGYPSANSIPVQAFNCVEQIRNAVYASIQFQSMPISFTYELIFGLLLNIFAFVVIYFLINSNKAIPESKLKFVAFVYKSPMFVKLWIWLGMAIFLTDFFRYSMTSIFALHKSAFTWSSFCIAGPSITILDKVGSFYEALLVGLACSLVIFKLNNALIPKLNFWHSDGECGYKAYSRFCFRLGTAIIILVAAFSWMWGSYIKATGHYPNDLWYLFTPLLSVALLVYLYWIIIRNALSISSCYERCRKEETAIIESDLGAGREAAYAKISRIPKNPMELYLGRHGFLLFQKILPLPVSSIFALIGYLATGTDMLSALELIGKLLKA